MIGLSTALIPMARWKQTLASVKLNVLLDLRGDIPAFASLHAGQWHEVASRDEVPVYPGSYYVINRACLLVAIAKRRLQQPQSSWTILQIASVTPMEQFPLPDLRAAIVAGTSHCYTPNHWKFKYSQLDIRVIVGLPG